MLLARKSVLKALLQKRRHSRRRRRGFQRQRHVSFEPGINLAFPPLLMGIFKTRVPYPHRIASRRQLIRPLLSVMAKNGASLITMKACIGS